MESNKIKSYLLAQIIRNPGCCYHSVAFLAVLKKLVFQEKPLFKISVHIEIMWW